MWEVSVRLPAALGYDRAITPGPAPRGRLDKCLKLPLDSRKHILSDSGALKTHLPGPHLQRFSFKCSKVDPGLSILKNSSENSKAGKAENHTLE